jgi:beta-lactam-binding protein with PASTA domain
MSPPHRQSVLVRLLLALVCAVLPGALHAQDTLKIPTTTTTAPRVPAGTVITRPPTTVTRPPVTVARPPGTVTQPSGTATEEGQQQLVTVPDLSGRTPAEARRILTGAGLVIGRVAEGQGGGQGTPGTVEQQQPRAGSVVAAKSDVRLWLVPESRQQPTITIRPPVTQPRERQRVIVPRLIGQTVADARAEVAGAGLEVGAVTEVTGGTPGTVVRQLPAAGSPVEPRSVVRLWVVPARVAADPPRDTLVRVPNLAGRTPAQARAALAAAGLRVAAVADGTGTGAPGTIARQQPAAGASVARGSGVRMWLVPAQVATRPDPPVQNPPVQEPADPPVQNPVQNPPVQNPPVQNPVQNPPVQNPVVDSVQAPAGPRTPDSLSVPDVRRLALDEARAQLEMLGFAVALDAGMEDSASWTVRAQQPGPGARLASGGVVALLLDPPASGAVAGTTAGNVPSGGSGLQPSDGPPVAAAPWYTRRPTWIALAVVLLVAAAVGARALRGGRPRALPVTAVRARLRMDAPASVAVEGTPFAAGGLRFRMNPGRTAARVSGAGPLFVTKEVSRNG